MTTDFVTDQKRTAAPRDSLRLDPAGRLVPRFDPAGIAKFPVAEPGQMGFRVLDDCCQEHIM